MKGPITSQFKDRVDAIVKDVDDNRTDTQVDGSQLDLEEYLAELQARHGDDPKRTLEYLDSTPMAPPVGYKRQPSLTETIRNMVREHAFAQAMAAQGVETFEEADDFDVGDFDPSSPYEEQFDPTPASELRRRAQEAQQPPQGGSGGTPPPMAQPPAGGQSTEPQQAPPPQPLPSEGK